MLSAGFAVSFGVCPAARVTAIVSPTALEMERITAAMIPDRAAGVTILLVTSNLVDPIAYAPSLSDRGTAVSASSHRLETSGRIMIPTTIAPEAALKTSTLGKTLRRRGVTWKRAK